MRTFSRAQDVVSTIMCWCCHASSVGGDLSAKQGEFFAEQASAASHTGILPRAAVVLPSLSEFSPSYKNLVPEYWRDVIVAGRSRKSSASFGTPAIVSFRELAAVYLAMHERAIPQPSSPAKAGDPVFQRRQ